MTGTGATGSWAMAVSSSSWVMEILGSAPVSARIFWASTLVMGASTEKWSAFSIT